MGPQNLMTGIIALLLFAAVAYYYITMLRRARKTNIYLHMLIQLQEKDSKVSESTDFNKLFEEAKKVN